MYPFSVREGTVSQASQRHYGKRREADKETLQMVQRLKEQ